MFFCKVCLYIMTIIVLVANGKSVEAAQPSPVTDAQGTSLLPNTIKNRLPQPTRQQVQTTETIQQTFSIRPDISPFSINLGITSPGAVYIDLSWNGVPLSISLQNRSTKQTVATISAAPSTARLSYMITAADLQKGLFWVVTISAHSSVSGTIRIISPKADQSVLAKAIDSQRTTAAPSKQAAQSSGTNLPTLQRTSTITPSQTTEALLTSKYSSAHNVAPSTQDGSSTSSTVMNEAVPKYAKRVSEKEWLSLVQRPDFHIFDQESLAIQKRAAEKQLSEDIATIQAAERTIGQKLIPSPAIPDENTTILADGNLLHTVSVKGGKRRFTTMGDQWSIHSVANALRSVASRQNQLLMYETFYYALDPKVADQLALISPVLLNKNPGNYSDATIRELVKTLANNADQLQKRYNSPSSRFFASKCEGNSGQGAKGDELGNSPFCGFNPNGIYMNFPFSMQRDLTCVKDQDNRGTCAAFAVAADLEYHVHKSTGQYVNLSEQTLYHQAKFNWYRNDLQDGAWPFQILEQMATSQWPIPFENQWDYNPSHERVTTMAAKSTTTVTSYTDSCNSYSETCSDSTHQAQLFCYRTRCGFSSPAVNQNGLGFRVTRYGQAWDPKSPDTSINLMLLSLVFKNPIIWSFSITHDWDTPSDAGFVGYHSKQYSRGAHATLIVGFIENSTLARILPNAPPAKNKGYFIVKNSWSTCYGDGGYAYVPYDYVREYTLEAALIHGVQ